MVELTLIACASTGDILVDGGLDCHDACLLKEKNIALRSLKKLKKGTEIGCFHTGVYLHYYIFRGKILCLTICDKYYPAKLASRFLEQVSDKFVKMHRVGPNREKFLRNFRSTIDQAEKFYNSSIFQINYWTLIGCNSDGVRLAEICDDEWNLDSKEKYSKEAINLFLKRVEAVELSAVMDEYTSYCLAVGDISYMTICSKLYPSKLAFEYLKEIKNKFESQSHCLVQHAKIDSALHPFGPVMKETVNLYWDTRSKSLNHVDADELRKKADLNTDYVEKADDDMIKSLNSNISGHDSVEMSKPLTLLDDNAQVVQHIGNENGDYFRMATDNGRSFELHQDIYQGLFLHQRQALKWFWSLHRKGKGAILADDMGLGKTRSVLAFLVGLFHSELIHKALIVVPKTIVEQWEDAISHIGLGEICRVYTNAKSHEGGLDYIAKQGGLMITSYPMLQKHHVSVVGETVWDYIFLDEGHRLKNPQAKTSRILSAVQCTHKIVVTGTPVQNDLSEFYALINLCNPDLLGTELTFHEKFSLAIQRGKHKDATPNQKRLAIKASKELNMIVAPYMLRRTKQILRESGRLPNKHELTIWLKMTPLQIRLYEKFLKIPNYKISGAGLAAAQVARDICNHPMTLKHDEPGKKKKGIAAGYVKRLLRSIPVKHDIISSCKISFMLHLVSVMLEQNHKILIFSQSCLMLKFAEKALVEILQVAKNKIMRMDGATPQSDRDVMINTFQPEGNSMKKTKLKKPVDSRYEDPQIFLMTTYVGGVGLNLTNATRVIIMDPAKNPSTDNQSVDRAYRLGQKKDVIVYRLITCGTIEEHTYREQIIKGELSTSVTENKQCERSMLKETHRVLIAPVAGFDQSITQVEIQEQFGNGFGSDMRNEIRSIRKHRSVFDINNHSLLFTLEESLSFTHEVESSGSKSIPQHRYRKKKAEIVMAGQGYALEPLSENWAQYEGPEPKGPVTLSKAHTKQFTVKRHLGSILSKNRKNATKALGPHSRPGECSRIDDRQYTPAAELPDGPGECSRKGGRQYDRGKQSE